MQSGTFRERGLELVREAVQFDQDGRAGYAVQQYELGARYLLAAAKWEQSENIRQTLYEKAAEYVDRAETLKLGSLRQSGRADRSPRPNGAQPTPSSTAPPPPPREVVSAHGAAAEEQQPERSAALTRVTWDSVVGLDETKKHLEEAAVLPAQRPSLFTGARSPPRGILLYGPPGTGKSYISAALAHRCSSNFLNVSSADIITKWLGESTRSIQELFKKARENRPTIIFIDEIDALVSERDDGAGGAGAGGGGGGGSSGETDRVKNQILVEMDGVESDMDQVLVLGATNRPWAIDRAMLRRMERRIYVPLPDAKTREKMIRHKLAAEKHTLTDDDFRRVASCTDGLSGADVKALVRDAALMPLRALMASRFQYDGTINKWVVAPAGCAGHGWDSVPAEQDIEVPPIGAEHVLVAATGTRRTVTERDLQRFRNWTETYGTDGS